MQTSSNPSDNTHVSPTCQRKGHTRTSSCRRVAEARTVTSRCDSVYVRTHVRVWVGRRAAAHSPVPCPRASQPYLEACLPTPALPHARESPQHDTRYDTAERTGERARGWPGTAANPPTHSHAGLSALRRPFLAERAAALLRDTRRALSATCHWEGGGGPGIESWSDIATPCHEAAGQWAACP